VDIEGDPAINPKANIVYRLVHGGLNPDISLDSVSGLFTYVKSPTFFGKDSIRYAVINKDVPNRADTALVWIFVGNKDIGSRTFLIPNAFSPNGDGINDYFVITTIYAYSTEESELEIYNRWGSLVYRSKDKSYDNKWDGHANANLISIGDVLPNGTYFYIYKVTFNVNGVLNKEEYNGFIELRR
nr:gliding motility-associated C-terminal domain-containing protein [Breznakibacter sp.]